MTKWTIPQTKVSDMVETFRSLVEQEKNVQLSARLIKEEYEEWLNEKTGTVEDLKELADLVYVVYGYANAAGYNLDEAVKRVHENNIGRCFQPDATILRREDGKIMKNKDYPKVYLEDLV